MTLEPMDPSSEDAIVSLPVAARRSGTPAPDVMAILKARYTGQRDTIL
ncbi:hypothetical protein [Jannaschia rubra]|nr:hypothetical protein [Jannaschia rubra]